MLLYHLLTTCNKLENNIGLVTRLGLTILIQDCHRVDNVRMQQYCYIRLLLWQTFSNNPATIRSDSAIKLVTCCSNTLEKTIETIFVNCSWTHLLLLVCRFVTTCPSFTRVHNTVLYRTVHGLQAINKNNTFAFIRFWNPTRIQQEILGQIVKFYWDCVRVNHSFICVLCLNYACLRGSITYRFCPRETSYGRWGGGGGGAGACDVSVKRLL